ncbi:hypothetical protein L7F22_045491 [Adiantum nelumboides]|nr:hypothetical protein [Adiantum nelumboides]
MDSNMNRQFESQRDDENPIFSQTALPHPNFHYPSFHLPPQSFQAMLNSPSISPNSPFMFRPPHLPIVPQSPNPSPLLGVPNMESPPNPQGPQASLNSAPNLSLASQPKPNHGKSTKRKEPSNEEVVPETQLPVPKKTRASKKKVMVDLGEDDDNDNKKSKWLDFWVDQLIHVRAAMNDEFNNPGKQGINLRAKVATKLAGIYPEFDKDSESCRKKWQAVLAKYRVDKAHNSISGNDRKHTCKWFDVVDEYYHDRATVTPLSHASSLTMDNAAFLVGDEDVVPLDDEKPQASMSSGRRVTPKYEESLVTMADTGKQLLEHLKETSTETVSLERQRLKILSGLHATMAEYLKDAKQGEM